MEGADRLSLRHLRVVEAVARFRSIRKAADAIHLSQPAVSQAMMRLEEQMGTNLFVRRSSGTFLTQAGDIFVPRIQMMFSEMEEAITLFGPSLGKGRTLSLIAERITRSQIRGLAAIARGTSFADASRTIGLSQPSLHRAARELERNLGKALFRQSIHGITTTDAGAELSRRLSLALRQIEWGIEEIQAATGHHRAQIKIGAMQLAGSFLLANPLLDLTRRYPGVDVRVTTGSSAYLTRCLQLGEIDFVVGVVHTSLDPEEFARETLFSSGYLIVARHDHPLAKRSSITAADLSRYEWIVPITGAMRREAFDRMFRAMPVRPKTNIETYSLSTIRLLLTGSDRLTLLTRFEFEFEKGRGSLTELPYHLNQPVHSLGVTTRIKWKPTAMHQEFLALMRHHAARIDHAHDASAMRNDNGLWAAASQTSALPFTTIPENH